MNGFQSSSSTSSPMWTNEMHNNSVEETLFMLPPYPSSSSTFYNNVMHHYPTNGPPPLNLFTDSLRDYQFAPLKDDGISMIFSSNDHHHHHHHRTAHRKAPIPASLKRKTTMTQNHHHHNTNGYANRIQKRPKNMINFKSVNNGDADKEEEEEDDEELIGEMKEIIYRAAALRPVNQILMVEEKKAKRKNTRISNDPQTAAARQRRERISERIRVLQRIVPGGTKMDTASMLDEAAHYLKFLVSQVKLLQNNLSNPTISSPLFYPSSIC